MQLKRLLRNTKQRLEAKKIIKILRLPIPLLWGLLGITLFAAFTVLTQFQFNKLNREQIYRARVDTYLNDIQVYEAAVRERLACLQELDARETEQDIYEVIAFLFEKSANIPTVLFPESPEAYLYEAEMKAAINQTLNVLIEEQLELYSEGDCPEAPSAPPTLPER